jgi:hypothetical protein
MDSQLALIAPAAQADKPAPATPGSAPLRNTFHERFALARASLFGLLEAAREAGYEKMTAGNAAKIDRRADVRNRIRYLAGDTAAQVQQLRAKVATKLNVIRDVSMHDFIRMEKDPCAIKYLREQTGPKAEAVLRAKLRDQEKSAAEIAAAIAAMPTQAEIEAAIERLPVLPFLDLTRVAELAPAEQREILSAVKSVSPTEHGPKVELHSPLDAIAQLRKMSGLDQPDKLDLGGKLTLEALVMASMVKPLANEPKVVEDGREGEAA